jgi:hypothetical protein
MTSLAERLNRLIPRAKRDQGKILSLQDQVGKLTTEIDGYRALLSKEREDKALLKRQTEQAEAALVHERQQRLRAEAALACAQQERHRAEAERVRREEEVSALFQEVDEYAQIRVEEANHRTEEAREAQEVAEEGVWILVREVRAKDRELEKAEVERQELQIELRASKDFNRDQREERDARSWR